MQQNHRGRPRRGCPEPNGGAWTPELCSYCLNNRLGRANCVLAPSYPASIQHSRGCGSLSRPPVAGSRGGLVHLAPPGPTRAYSPHRRQLDSRSAARLALDLRLLDMDLEDNPNDGRATFHRGVARAELGRCEEARRPGRGGPRWTMNGPRRPWKIGWALRWPSDKSITVAGIRGLPSRLS
jgi:hypothetical protein